MTVDQGQWRRDQLNGFIAEFVTPTLRPHGYRRSAHTFRKSASTGDQVAVQLAGWPESGTCSFQLEVSVLHEPMWDLAIYRTGFHDLDYSTLRLGKLTPGALRTSIKSPLDPDWLIGPWAYANDEQRQTLGDAIETVLLESVVPEHSVFLDRDAYLAYTPASHEARRTRVVLLHPPTLIERIALAAAQGPSDNLDHLLASVDADTDEQRVLEWAPLRAAHGIAWRSIQ